MLAAGGGYRLEAGTSFSAPLASGVAALMLASVRRSDGLPALDAAAAVRAALR